MSCQHTNTLQISCFHRDAFHCTFSDGGTYEGYGFLPGLNSRNEDLTDLTLCLDCGCLVGLDLPAIQESVERKMRLTRCDYLVSEIYSLLVSRNDLLGDDLNFVDEMEIQRYDGEISQQDLARLSSILDQLEHRRLWG